MKTSYTPQEVRELLNQLKTLLLDQAAVEFNNEVGTGYIFEREYENYLQQTFDPQKWINSVVPDIEEVEYCKPLVGETNFTIEPKPTKFHFLP